MSWPPCEEDFKNIALSALEKSNDVNVHVLVYWENDPNLMIFNPVIYAKTDYQSLTFKSGERTVKVEIGKVD